MKTLLFGANADSLKPLIARQPSLSIVSEAPDAIVCFGGDGTLLSAEHRWPGIPKIPIRNSRRGHRCIPHPAEEVIDRLVNGRLVPMKFMKLECAVFPKSCESPRVSTAMNEFNMHMGHMNSAVRFKIWFNDEAFADGREILGDGLIVSTPFGSTAYFTQITRGVFHTGIGVAFKNTTELTSHVIVPEDVTVRILITRGPAMLGFDNSQEYASLGEGDRLELHKHPLSATIMTWEPLPHPAHAF